MAQKTRKALFVYGGWEGHQPKESAAIVTPLLELAGFSVQQEQSLAVYGDSDLLAQQDVIVHNWSMGSIESADLSNLTAAVRSGVGFAGWHGGILDSFRMDYEYAHMVGGQFVAHPHGLVDFDVNIRGAHEVNAGLDDFSITSEQYWVLHDPLINVHASTTIPVREGDPWHEPVESPVAWTRRWGQGRVFASTLGHAPEELETRQVKQMLIQGIVWAANAWPVCHEQD